MKIYTKTGDRGETGLFAGPRVPKDHVRIEAYGAVDELNATLGVVRCETLPAELSALVVAIQNDLFCVGAELATPDPSKLGPVTLHEARVEALERAIDNMEARLTPLTQFILPGGTRAASLLHLARTVCRRAERRVISLRRSEPNVADRHVRYLNRLGDLLFVAARFANAQNQLPDEPWCQPGSGGTSDP